MALPAYDQCIKASHVFNLLDARGVISVTERQSYILRVRELAKACGEAWLATDLNGRIMNREPDCVADDAVRCQPVSNPNSLLTGKLTGNFVSFGLLSRFWCPDGERIQWLADKFPTQRNREFFCRNREFFGANREFSREIREPPILNGDTGRASPQASLNFSALIGWR